MAIEEAIEIVRQRGEEYGNALEGFARTGKFWSALFGIPVTAEQVALAMLLNKVSREMNQHKDDNLVDIAGYAEVVAMILKERDEAISVRANLARVTDNELIALGVNATTLPEMVRRFIDKSPE